MKYRLGISFYLSPIDPEKGVSFSGINISHSVDLEAADLREASNVMLSFHELAEAMKAKAGTFNRD